MPMVPSFSRYIGIDYSGARTPEASLKGLRVYCVDGAAAAHEVFPPPSPRKYWTRRGIAKWLADRLAEDVQTIVGIDHGFSFPMRYFEVHRLEPVTAEPKVYVFGRSENAQETGVCTDVPSSSEGIIKWFSSGLSVLPTLGKRGVWWLTSPHGFAQFSSWHGAIRAAFS